MTRLLLPLALTLVGIGAGVGTGLALRPPADGKAHAGPPETTDAPTATQPAAPKTAKNAVTGYIELNNQFIVPVIGGDRVSSLVILSLSLEITGDDREKVYAREPKLRDVLLQVMFDHANMGGFDGRFTDANTLDVLRQALTEAARKVIGPEVNKVLIVDIARQDI